MTAQVLHFINQDLVKETPEPTQQGSAARFDELMGEATEFTPIYGSINIQESMCPFGHPVWATIEVKPANPMSGELEWEEGARKMTQ
jgi:hypothetical protein